MLDRKDLDSIADSIRSIYDPQPTPSSPTPAAQADIEQMIARMELLRRKGFIFRTHNLKQLEQVLQEEGRNAEAAKVERTE